MSDSSVQYLTMSDDDMAYFYEHLDSNTYKCRLNDYIVVYNNAGERVDIRKWDGHGYVPLSYRNINNDYIGKIRPRNTEQEIAFDLLQDPLTRVKLLIGRQGSGKDYLMLSHAFELIGKGIYDKLIFVRNNIPVRHTNEIGFLPGGDNDKIMPYAMLLADHLGGRDALESLISRGIIELRHLGFMRGRDIKDAIIYCTEAENLTKDHVQMLLGRVGEGSALWINGDLKQVDKDIFKKDSGLSIMMERLHGDRRFGFAELIKSERSEVAAMADLLD